MGRLESITHLSLSMTEYKFDKSILERLATNASVSVESAEAMMMMDVCKEVMGSHVDILLIELLTEQKDVVVCLLPGCTVSRPRSLDQPHSRVFCATATEQMSGQHYFP
jgi:hypothetical protein